jgi:hypothetical protein
MKNAVFWDVTPCGSFKTRRFVTNNRRTLRRNTSLLVMANFVPSSPIFVTVRMEELSSSETPVVLCICSRLQVKGTRRLLCWVP